MSNMVVLTEIKKQR